MGLTGSMQKCGHRADVLWLFAKRMDEAIVVVVMPVAGPTRQAKHRGDARSQRFSAIALILSFAAGTAMSHGKERLTP